MVLYRGSLSYGRTAVLKKVEFSELVAAVVSEASNCIHTQEAYAGDKTYKISIYRSEEEKAFYITVAEDDVMVCIKNLRADMDTYTAIKAFEDLERRLGGLFAAGSAEISQVVNPDENAELLEQPLMVQISGKNLFPDDKQKKKVCSEFNDWLDGLLVMMASASAGKKNVDYKKEYDKVMAGGTLVMGDHKEKEDYSGTMAIITLVLTVLGIIFKDLLVFSLMGLMAGGFSAYRCFANKNYKGLVVCGICVVACVVFAYLGWEGVKTGIQGQINK